MKSEFFEFSLKFREGRDSTGRKYFLLLYVVMQLCIEQLLLLLLLLKKVGNARLGECD